MRIEQRKIHMSTYGEFAVCGLPLKTKHLSWLRPAVFGAAAPGRRCRTCQRMYEAGNRDFKLQT
jgi:hypothetical protein